jgi:hypothetical protein
MPICFDISVSDAEITISRLLPRYYAILEEQGFKLSKNRVKELLSFYFPDLRSLANQIEFEQFGVH